MLRLSSERLQSTCCSVLNGRVFSTKHCRWISLASFRFPWLSNLISTEVADTSSSALPSSVKPWHSASEALAVNYPHVPQIAALDFPITKHERFYPDISQAFGTWDYDVELSALCARLRVPKEHLETVRLALTHPSFLLVLQQERADEGLEHVEQTDLDHYGQLSCYGRSASRMFLVEHIHHHYPNLVAEGINELANHLLQESRLAAIVQHLGMVDLIQRTTQIAITADDTATLTDVFYAIVGALLRCGEQVAQEFVRDYVIAQLQEENIADAIRFEHPKLMLRHLLREQHKPAPIARLLNDAGHKTAHSVYYVAVYCGTTAIGKGFGRTLESAEEEACRDALRQFFLTELTFPKHTPIQAISSCA
ncbi:large ribosomal subunit protein mL44-like [Sycon ciliatum]|uniref:large ribosomal subunit protein mL44-like n=1 Tax=Sycon ciliatum TaxID=27933 RepID=UPI0020AA2A29|eukprot:scpid85698/ scgid6651/ 39S ribosomal protein L44, mitochondrial